MELKTNTCPNCRSTLGLIHKEDLDTIADKVERVSVFVCKDCRFVALFETDEE